MNRAAVFQSSPVEQMMGGRTTGWWTSTSPQQNSPLCSSPPNLSSSSPSSLSGLPQYYPFPSGTGTLPSIPWHDNTQDLPESWSQLLLGGLEEDGRSNLVTPFQTKKEENNWEDQVLFQSPANAQMVDVIKKEERSAESTTGSYAYGINNGNHEEVQPHASACRSDPWYQILPVSSPRSCITSFCSNNMLDFSNNKADGRHPKPAGCSAECNGTASGSALKKARIQASTAQSSFKVRKEKLGDRITALHQLVSPFGKTDTASVLLEAIGYIRFLQSQIEALSSPYLDTTTSGSNTRNSLLNEACLKKRRGTCDYKEGETDEQKDLKSRGLCLVPISCTAHVGNSNENGADYWASAFGVTFR